MAKRVARLGVSVEADAVFDAWTSADLDRMRAALHTPTNPIERDHLLSGLIEQLYRRRADPALRRELFEVGAIHLREMPELRAAARAHRIAQRERVERAVAERAARDGCEPERLPRFDPDERFGIPTFAALAQAYCEVGEYEAAREAWRVARSVGYLHELQVAKVMAEIDEAARSSAAQTDDGLR